MMVKAWVKWNVAAMLMVAVGGVMAQSFDCKIASTDVEKIICSSNQLSLLDDQLARSYKATLAAKKDKVAFQNEQLQWLRNARNVCKDEGCLVNEYQKRIVDLWRDKNGKPKDSPYEFDKPPQIAPAVWPLQFKLVYGDSYPICQPYVDMLNKAKYKQYPACERKILPEFKQFSDVQWTQITDEREMERILKEDYDIHHAMKMKVGGKERYKDYDKNKDYSREMIAKKIQDGEMGLYMARFDFEGDGDSEVIYKKVVQHSGLNGCVISSGFYVADHKITIDNAESVWPGPYDAMSLDEQNDIFLSGSDQLFVSHWSKHRGNLSYNLSIYKAKNPIHGFAGPVCSINF